jgi:hypothetical protein
MVSSSDSGSSPKIAIRHGYQLMVFGLFAAELLLLAFLQRSTLLSFDNYYFQDQGTNLVAQYLANSGLRPAVDFGYNWGLLGLLFGRVWFAVFGASPTACAAGLFVTAGLGVAWALARIVVLLDFDSRVIAIVVLTLPFSARFLPPSFAHGVEAALLANAIAYQLEGRKSVALALATAALFARPGLGYFYGAWLLLLMARDVYRRGSFGFRDLTLLLPAALTGLGLAIVLGATYSPQSLMYTITPARGAANYRASHYGFFNQGKSFLYSSGNSWAWYLLTPAGLWIVASLWLLLRCAQPLRALVRGRATDRQELTATCAFLHVVFVLLIFGNRWTWTYYFFVLVIGTIAAVNWRTMIRFERLYVHGIVAFSLLLFISYAIHLDAGYSLDPETGLWCSAAESNEWERVLQLVDGKRSALMVEAGAGALLSTRFQKPVAMYLLPEYQTGSEPDREARQIRDSEVIVTTNFHPTSLGSCLNYYPKLREALRGAHLTYLSKDFVVYERRRGER